MFTKLNCNVHIDLWNMAIHVGSFNHKRLFILFCFFLENTVKFTLPTYFYLFFNTYIKWFFLVVLFGKMVPTNYLRNAIILINIIINNYTNCHHLYLV